MKCIVSTACVLSVLVVVSYAAPYFPTHLSASTNLQIGGSGSSSSTNASSTGGGLTDVLSSIDLPGLLRGVNSFVKLVGVFCPPLSQVLDNVIQNVTSQAFRIFGRAILRNGLGGGGGASNNGSGSRVNVVLPTFPPDEDDYDDEDEDSTSASDTDDVDVRIATSSIATTQASSATTTTQATSSQSVSPVSEDNTISKRHVRVVREAEAEQEAEEEEDDQDGAESAPEPAEDLANIDIEDADRNKRYLPWGGSGGHGGAAAGGSGNFLFDIIRLVAGSGATEETDEKANGPGGVLEVDVGKEGDVHGSGEGIPGPITRLFVVANRGLANLIQDLILRLAQTSERLVNFKARVVTALI